MADTSLKSHTGKVFLCYRREDSGDITGRFYDRLVQHFGRDAIFKDVDSIPLGVDFRTHIDQIIKQVSVVIVMIGDRWLDARTADGKPRLAQPLDHVRAEIQSALMRDIPIIPLLLRDADMPGMEALPEPIQNLAYRNGGALRSDPHFHNDVTYVISHLERLMTPPTGADGSLPDSSKPMKDEGTPAKVPQPADVVLREPAAPSEQERNNPQAVPGAKGDEAKPAFAGSSALRALRTITPALRLVAGWTGVWLAFEHVCWGSDHWPLNPMLGSITLGALALGAGGAFLVHRRIQWPWLWGAGTFAAVVLCHLAFFGTDLKASRFEANIYVDDAPNILIRDQAPFYVCSSAVALSMALVQAFCMRAGKRRWAWPPAMVLAAIALCASLAAWRGEENGIGRIGLYFFHWAWYDTPTITGLAMGLITGPVLAWILLAPPEKPLVR